MSLHQMSIRQLQIKLRNKELSSVELTQHFLNRIDQYNPSLNAYIDVFHELAMAQAKEADQRLQNNDNITSLTGIPVGMKDIFCMQGTRTTCGSKMLENFTSPYDATVVRQLKDAGAVILGKLNMDEFAMGSSNETSYFGTCANPWHTDYVPGGSSGGSSSAMAARLAAATTGTDTGGSIRQPASLCGITGLKPTYGRVSRYGMIAYASSLDQGGPMAASAEDCAMLLQHMAGYDPQHDATTQDINVPNYASMLEESIANKTIGLPKEFFTDDLNQDVAKKIQDIIEIYKSMGAKFKEISLPNNHLSIPVYYVLAPSECSSNLSRYDGIRYGHRDSDAKDLETLYKMSRSEAFGSEVKRRILVGTYALSSGFYGAYYQKAQKIRALIRHDYEQAFNEVDLILGPTTPTTAFKIGEKVDDPIQMYLSDIYTTAVNLASLPAISAPAGFINDMPIGFQLTGPAFKEGALLSAVHQLQQHTDWHTQIPHAFV